MAERRIRVLYSFPHKIGAARICSAAWHQVDGLVKAGVDVLVYTAAIARPLDPRVLVQTTLAWKKLRLPARILGTRRYCMLHDRLVARKLAALGNAVDIVHTWPLGALHTLEVARKLDIPTVLERPNAHTKYAYEIVQAECQKLGLSMPPGHEHDYNAQTLRREEREYQLATKLLCPSDFVARTFLDEGFPETSLARHQYGFAEKAFFPAQDLSAKGLTVLFAAGCAPRKGLHYALDAWLKSSASRDGKFLVAGEFIPGYAELLARQLAHPSVKLLGYRNDLADVMRHSDILVLPSIEEGSALVTSEARGSGCVLLVSEASGAVCKHGVNALVHSVGDVNALTEHFNLLNTDRACYERLREASLKTVNELTWTAAGRKLADIYRGIVNTREVAPSLTT